MIGKITVTINQDSFNNTRDRLLELVAIVYSLSDMLDDLEERIKDITEHSKIPNGKCVAETHWISIANQLPESGTHVIGYDEFYGRVGETYEQDGHLYFIDSDDCYITHWQPLPPLDIL